jgi:nitrate reductase cytochrome c-type subunit
MNRQNKNTTLWLLVALLALALAAPVGCGDDDSGSNNSNVNDNSNTNDTDAGVQSNVPYPGAPPNMPHEPYSCEMNCLMCHETGSGGAPTTPHPERAMCTQCHLPQNDVADYVTNTFTAYP